MLTLVRVRDDNGRMSRQRRAADQEAFRDLTDRWLASHAEVNTRAAYAVDLAKFGQWCVAHEAMPLQADVATVAAFQEAQRADGHSVATQRRRWSALTSFFQFALDAGLIDTNPASAGQRPALAAGGRSSTPILTADAVDAYLEAATALDPRLDALVSLLVLDGLKLGEALALDIDDVHGRPPKITVVVRRRRQGAQRITLQPRSARAVHRCVDLRVDEPLFTGPRRHGVAHRLTRFGADHLLKKLDHDDTVSANALRRFHITAHHTTGAALDDVRDRAGLNDIRTIRRYLQCDADGRADQPTNSAQPEPRRPRRRRPDST